MTTVETRRAGSRGSSLLAREAEVERRLVKLAKQRRRIRERLTRVDAA